VKIRNLRWQSRVFWLIGVIGVISMIGLAGCSGVGQAPDASPEVTATPTDPPNAEAGPTRTPRPTATPEATVRVLSVVLTRGLSPDFRPLDPGDTFRPEQPVSVAVQVQGRPRTGEVVAAYFFRDALLLQTAFDLAIVNGDVTLNTGEDTFIGFTMTPQQPLPISERYRVEISVDGELVQSYPFSIVAPEDALPSAIATTVLARGIDAATNPIDPTDSFGPDETVFLVGQGSFGKGSALQADWFRAGGELLAEGSRSLFISDNIAETGFYFNFLPEGGWVPGDYEVVLTLDDREVERLGFRITPAPTPDPQAVGVFTDPQPYRFPSGLFTLDIPQAWQREDRSTADSVSQTWTAAANRVLVSVDVVQRGPEPDLSLVLQQELIATFGNQPDFALSNPVLQPDGSVLATFTLRDAADPALLLRGNAVAKQRGDKLAILILLAPDAEYDALWAAGLQTIAQSFTLDPAAPLAPPARPSDDGAALFADPQPYRFPNGLFELVLPATWELTDRSTPSTADLEWRAPNATVRVQSTIRSANLSVLEVPLATQQALTTRFGTLPEFQISNPQAQPDGSVLVAFTMRDTPDAGAVLLRGNGYGEQRGDKFALLTLLAPADQFDALWEAGLADIANSYRINPDVALAAE
jgi:hypothetical protein